MKWSGMKLKDFMTLNTEFIKNFMIGLKGTQG